MITITLDPQLETPPNFMAGEHKFTRQAVMHDRLGMSEERAAEILLERWTVEWEQRKIRWAEEAEEREDVAREEEMRREAEEERAGRSQTIDAESIHARPSRAASPNDKGDIPNIVVGKAIPQVIEYPPARFAIKKLREREYIELSYFTPEARLEAAKTESVSSNDVFTLTQEDSLLSLRPVSNFRSKTKMIQDEDLTWEQLSVASICFLEHIVQEKWPSVMVDVMHSFFFRLTHHKLRNEGAEGNQVLLMYQARARREWHRQLKNPPKDGIFDIGLIDDGYLRSLKDQLYDSKRKLIMAG
ncbi:hypothetical protein C0992_003992 [Termitomyces sp. T32_za158]|nr:hypothetical protein C0992_003992 [Termitomyces sp. T32_za158]